MAPDNTVMFGSDCTTGDGRIAGIARMSMKVETVTRGGQGRMGFGIAGMRSRRMGEDLEVVSRSFRPSWIVALLETKMAFQGGCLRECFERRDRHRPGESSKGQEG